MPTMKTNYGGHDTLYKQRKALGQAGWDDEEVYKHFQAELAPQLDAAGAEPGMHVLELGCGAGNMTVWLAQRGFDAWGIDIAPTAIAWAQERATSLGVDNVHFNVGSVLDLQDFADARFDIVFDGHCFHCIIGRDREAFLQSALRVLKPGGRFLLSSMCGEIRSEAMKQQFDPTTRNLIKDGEFASRHIGLAKGILEEVRTAGFSILSWHIESGEGTEGCDCINVIATK